MLLCSGHCSFGCSSGMEPLFIGAAQMIQFRFAHRKFVVAWAPFVAALVFSVVQNRHAQPSGGAQFFIDCSLPEAGEGS